MTSRTPLGIQQRQPQRTLSSSSLSTAQRQAPQPRALSQQHAASSPSRKDNNATHSDLFDSNDQTQNRHGINTPRRGGSRLRLELSSDHAITGAQMAVESPQSLASASASASARALANNGEPIDVANSPAPSRASHADMDNPPMPMPKRRQLIATRAPVPREQLPVIPAAKKDGRPKPYTVEIPTEAPRLASTNRQEGGGGDIFGKGLFSGRADFFPWTGKHLEDEWTSESITKGIWEKYSSTENSSARMAISPSLKQKSGLNALSTIFMGALNQRRQRGQITSSSTFKPPPRVTLTDTKREVWLKDLANPSTSLRRLSRTIPHGIRGRALLDQCLNKNVPTERAVWLAKCVGANEIRAFKRKGVNGAFVMGGEIKWCKDWTIFVEQFVDSVVSSINEEDWKFKVTYAIRLATSLYAEHLIDRDHYLDWIMSGLEGSNQGRLPMWMLIARIYWSDLLHSRKYGRRLVTALLNHVHTIQNNPDRDILSRLSGQLSTMLASLTKSNPESFVCPITWAKYRDTLKAIAYADDEHVQKAFNHINTRNIRLALAGSSYPLAGRQQLIRLLDRTLQNSAEDDFAVQCWAASDDKTRLVKTVVEWATSVHRSGLARVYVSTSLLKTFRAWSSSVCFDTTMAILNIVDSVGTGDTRRAKLIYHLIAELARERIFLVPCYLQWLISRGGFQDASEIDPDTGSCFARILIEMPVDSLSSRLRTERANLLRRAGDYSVASEAEDVAMAIKHVDHALGLPLPAGDLLSQKKPMSLRKLLGRLQNSNRALKCAIGSHLRGMMVKQGSTGSANPAGVALLTSVRTLLESIEDFSMLSEIVQSCLKSSDAEILATCADTINANLGIFLGLGSASESFSVLFERLKSLGQQGTVPRPVLAAVTHLAQRLPGREAMAKQLQQDLLQCDRSSAIDACSPVSDSMVPQTQSSGEVELSEEIDKLLASGNRIDHPTMNRLFRTIVPRLEAGWAKEDDSRRVFANLLTKMRVFDPQHFDKLMSDWVCHVASLNKRSSLAELFPLLVTGGCITVSTLLHTANAASPVRTNVQLNSEQANVGSATYLQELLSLLLLELPKSTMLTAEEAYRFKIHQRATKTDNPLALLTLIRNSIVEYSSIRSHNETAQLTLDDSGLRNEILDALRILVVSNSSAASEALSVKDLSTTAADVVSKLTTKLLLPNEPEDRIITFDQILGLATELTLPFCQLKLEYDLSSGESSLVSGEEPTPSRFDLFSNAMDRAIEANNITWTSMLPCLSGDISQHLKSLAHGRFLGLIPSLKSGNLEEAASRDQAQLAQNLLGVIEAITAGQPPPRSAQFSNTLIDRLCDLCEIIASRGSENVNARMAVIEHWLPSVLRLITLHGLASESGLTAPAVTTPGVGKVQQPSVNHNARARIVNALCSLLLELQLLPGQATGNLPLEVFDVAILLADGLPEDLRQLCAKNVLLLPGTSATTGHSSDPRIHYILSTPQLSTAENLVFSHKEKIGTTPSVGPRGMGAMYGIGPLAQEKLTPFVMRRWEMLSESTPIIGENDTSLSLSLFEAIKIQ